MTQTLWGFKVWGWEKEGHVSSELRDPVLARKGPIHSTGGREGVCGEGGGTILDEAKSTLRVEDGWVAEAWGVGRVVCKAREGSELELSANCR